MNCLEFASYWFSSLVSHVGITLGILGLQIVALPVMMCPRQVRQGAITPSGPFDLCSSAIVSWHACSTVALELYQVLRGISQFWIVYLCLLCGGPADAQENREKGLRFNSLARVAQTRVKADGIAVLKATVTNSGSDPAEGTLVANVMGVTDNQSARKVSLAGGESNAYELYIQMPESLVGQNMVEIKVTLVEQYGDQEVIVSTGGRPAEHELTLSVDRLPTLAALIMDQEPDSQPFWYWPPLQPHASYELSVASRVDAGNSRETANFESSALPVNTSDWDLMDVTILSDENALADASFVESLKRFVSSGGKLWIMLDRISTDSVRPLLGAGQTCETLDEIELNDFVVEVSGSITRLEESDRTVNSDQPFTMKRVLHSGGRVTHTIDGWPAAIWMPVGYGEILLTTLDCNAMIVDRPSPSLDMRMYAAYTTQMWARQLVLDVNAGRYDVPLNDKTDYALQQIGNPVVPRAWVARALVGFCLLLAIIGGRLAWVGELSLLGAIVPVVSLLFGVVLMIASTYVRKDVPESNAKLQLIQVVEDGNSALVREKGAVHLEGEASMQLVSSVDGHATVAAEMASGIPRYTTTDFQEWELSNRAWSSGTWRYNADYVLPTSEMVAQAQVTEKGVELKLPDSLSQLEDPVFTFAVGDPMLCSTNENGLTCDGSLEADGERWITGTIISNEQQRRLQVYQQFFKADDRVGQLSHVLYGWTAPWGDGPKWSKDLEINGGSLVAMPVRLQRPPGGKPIYVPHGLVQLQRDPDKTGQTSAFNERTGKWTKELTYAAEADLQFTLPPELLPFSASELDLVLDIKAPNRNVRLLANVGSERVEVVALQSPSIPWQATITQPEILEDMRDGVLKMTLEVSERTDVSSTAAASSVVAWEIDRFRMSVRGMVEVAESPNP